MSNNRKFEQRGGNPTPLPLRYFSGENDPECNYSRYQQSYNSCGYPMKDIGSFNNNGNAPNQNGGGPTPLPLAYFNPEAEVRPGYGGEIPHNVSKCGFYTRDDYYHWFYNSDMARQKAKEYAKMEHKEQCGGQMGGGHYKHSDSGYHRNINPLPRPLLDLDRNLDTLGSNSEVINRDNLRRLFNTYKKMYG